MIDTWNFAQCLKNYAKIKFIKFQNDLLRNVRVIAIWNSKFDKFVHSVLLVWNQNQSEILGLFIDFESFLLYLTELQLSLSLVFLKGRSENQYFIISYCYDYHFSYFMIFEYLSKSKLDEKVFLQSINKRFGFIQIQYFNSILTF